MTVLLSSSLKQLIESLLSERSLDYLYYNLSIRWGKIVSQQYVSPQDEKRPSIISASDLERMRYMSVFYWSQGMLWLLQRYYPIWATGKLAYVGLVFQDTEALWGIELGLHTLWIVVQYNTAAIFPGYHTVGTVNRSNGKRTNRDSV